MKARSRSRGWISGEGRVNPEENLRTRSRKRRESEAIDFEILAIRDAAQTQIIPGPNEIQWF